MVKKEGHRISCRFTRATTRTVLFVRQGKGEKKSQRRRSVPLCQPRCRVGRCERCEVECESGGAESRETKAKIGSRVLKLRPLCRVVSHRGEKYPWLFPGGQVEKKGKRGGGKVDGQVSGSHLGLFIGPVRLQNVSV